VRERGEPVRGTANGLLLSGARGPEKEREEAQSEGETEKRQREGKRGHRVGAPGAQHGNPFVSVEQDGPGRP
jgi:hypothetical protein